jgi:hypothetical protein
MGFAAFNVNQLYVISLQSDKKLHKLEEVKAEFLPMWASQSDPWSFISELSKFFAMFSTELKKIPLTVEMLIWPDRQTDVNATDSIHYATSIYRHIYKYASSTYLPIIFQIHASSNCHSYTRIKICDINLYQIL